MPHFSKLFTLESDAYDNGLGVVLFQCLERKLCGFIPYKRSVLFEKAHETFSDLGIINDKTSKKVGLSLQALKLPERTRRRQIYNGLNF